MQKVTFFEWTIYLQDNLVPVTDLQAKKIVIMQSALDLNAVIWIDENNKLQIKPTWDCVISVDSTDKSITIRHVNEVFYSNDEE